MRKLMATLALLTLFGFAAFATGETESAESEPATLQLWDTQTQGLLKDVVEAAVADYSSSSDATIEVSHFQADPYKTKLQVAMGANNPPDIFQSWGGGPLKEYIDSGMVEPVPDYVVDALSERLIPAAFDPVTFDGQVYGAPMSSLTGVYFWYRKDTFEMYDLEVPTTWTEFLDVCETLKTNDVVPLALANKPKWPGSFYYMYLADRIGGSHLFQDALYRRNGVTFEDPAFIRAGEMIEELVRSGYFPEGVNGMDEGMNQASSMLYTQQAGMYLMGSWFLSVAQANYPDMMDELGFFNFPAVEDGIGDPSSLIGSPGQDYMVVTSTSANKDVAFDFIAEELMNQDWVEAMVANGYVPPVIGVADLLSDPSLRQIAESFESAKSVQVYYDQYMAPAMAEVHKDATQALFGLAMTAEEVARAHEDALAEEMGE